MFRELLHINLLNVQTITDWVVILNKGVLSIMKPLIQRDLKEMIVNISKKLWKQLQLPTQDSCKQPLAGANLRLHPKS